MNAPGTPTALFETAGMRTESWSEGKPASSAAVVIRDVSVELVTVVRMVEKMAFPTEPPADRNVPRRPDARPSSFCGTCKPVET